MIGVIFGLACGVAEFLLLLRLVNTITEGKPISLWIVPAKIGILGLFFLPVGFLCPEELYLTGIGTAAVLIIGALLRVSISKRKKDNPSTPSGKQSTPSG